MLKSLDIGSNQFNAFGCAMHVPINFSRLEKRGGRERDIKSDMEQILKILKFDEKAFILSN
jgi:hypothetical protein